MKPTRIFIADDHPIVRLGLATLIRTHRPDWEICGEAADGYAAVIAATAARADVVILDSRMPLLPGLAAATQLQERLPQVEILLFVDTEPTPTLRSIFRSRVSGCLVKSEATDELLPALDSLQRGHRFRSRQITELAERTAAATGETAALSPRETEVLRLIAEGRTSKEIAAQLGISFKTVETHRANLLGKLQLRSAVELARYAIRHGLVEA